MVSRRLKEKIKQLVPTQLVRIYHALRLTFVALYFKYCAIVYRGNTYFCPFCGQGFSRFLPDGEKSEAIARHGVIGGGYRTNCLCPNCRSKDRERMLLLFLQQKTQLFDTSLKSLLHIAPEKNLKKLFRQMPQLRYINADLNPGAADVQMDITAIPHPDSSFDYLLCNHVLEHIPNDAQAMRELFRVLKPGGTAILQVPFAEKLTNTYENFDITNPAEREFHFGQFDHVRIYGHDYPHRLEQAGFNVFVTTALEALGSDAVQKLSLIPDEKIFIGTKL